MKLENVNSSNLNTNSFPKQNPQICYKPESTTGKPNINEVGGVSTPIHNDLQLQIIRMMTQVLNAFKSYFCKRKIKTVLVTYNFTGIEMFSINLRFQLT